MREAQKFRECGNLDTDAMDLCQPHGFRAMAIEFPTWISEIFNRKSGASSSGWANRPLPRGSRCPAGPFAENLDLHHGRTEREPVATILLPNSVARHDIGWHDGDTGGEKALIIWDFSTQNKTGRYGL